MIMKKNSLKLASHLTLILCLLLSSCSMLKWWHTDKHATGKQFNYADAHTVTKGMGIEEVITILGQPYTVSQSSLDKQWIWSYSAHGATNTVAIQFQQDKVAQINRTSYQDKK